MKRFVANAVRQIDRRAVLCALALCLFMILFERAVLKVNYRGFLSYFLGVGKWPFSFYLLAIAISLLCTLVFCYVALVSSWKYKIVYFLIFALAIFFEYGYQNAFERFSYYTDLQIAAATTSELKLNAIAGYFNLWAIVPCVVFGATLIIFRQRTAHRLKSLIAVAVLFVSFSAGYWYAGAAGFSLFYNYPTVSLTAFTRTVISYSLFRAFSKRPHRDQVSSPSLAATFSPGNNIVFIVDESVRSDHLSLNGYARPTTPFLNELSQAGLLRNWGTAVSASTCSLISHDLLITGLASEELSESGDKVRTAPLIFQYARAMHYKTHYFDGQMSTVWGEMEGDGFKYVDNWVPASHFNSKASGVWDVDVEMAKEVNTILTSSTGNFIFIFKRGVHIPYHLTFPPAQKQWDPSFTGRAVNVPADQLPAVVNAYDNAIRYNSDSFFKALVTDYRNLPNNTVIIYTSDHGQTLGENGARHSHCGDTKQEAMVPLLMMGSSAANVDVNFKATHANLFATMLDLMSYPDGLRTHRYAISLLKAKAADSGPRYFVSSSRPNITWAAGRIVRFD